MEQWIYSQNKIMLVNMSLVLSLFIEDNVIACYVRDRRFNLGLYKTNERAREVFEEIANWLRGYDGEIPFYGNDFTFYMPEE